MLPCLLYLCGLAIGYELVAFAIVQELHGLTFL
jgi:hypothetical protein